MLQRPRQQRPAIILVVVRWAVIDL